MKADIFTAGFAISSMAVLFLSSNLNMNRLYPEIQHAKHAVIRGFWRDPKHKTSVFSQVLDKDTGGLWSELLKLLIHF